MGLGDLYHPNTDSNGLPEGYVAGQGNPFSSAIDNGYLGAADAIIPGFSFFNKMFDLNGSAAAQQQFKNQMALNKDAQLFDAQEAQKARNFQYEMRETNYQAMVRDLQKAGLNPYLALGNLGGSGAPSASSASASSGSADMANNKLTAAAGILALFLRMILKGK